MHGRRGHGVDEGARGGPRQLDAASFAHAWRTLGARHTEAIAELNARYAEPQRAHHDAEHIAECLAWLELTRHRAARPAELAVAVFFHDAVYVPGAPDNEARSAELLLREAERAGIGSAAAGRIARLIESTKHHAATQDDAALLADIDLAILGAAPERYARYEREVRQEYRAYPDALYAAGRARVLEGFLERPSIFRTPELARALEAPARRNLSRALDTLRGKR